MDIPGPVDDYAKRAIAGAVRSDVPAVRETANQYRYTYGPLFRGDFGTFGGRVVEHPVFVALDAEVGLPGLIGKGVGVAGKVRRVARPY